MTSSLADFALRHGRALVLVALSFALAGIMLIPQIPISIFPQTDFPRIVILVDNGIAPPNMQMTTVTRPIEEAIRLVPGVTTSALPRREVLPRSVSSFVGTSTSSMRCT